MSLGRRGGSFAEFSRVRNVLKNRSHQPQVDELNSSFTSSSGLSQSTYAEDGSILNNSMSIADTSPNTMYSSYSLPQTSVDHRTIGYMNTRSSNMSTTKGHWWQGSLRSNKGTQDIYELSPGHDGLPNYQYQQYDPWSSASGTASIWDPQSLTSNTIFPKMLSLNVSSTSLVSSGSSQGSVFASSKSGAAVSVDDSVTPQRIKPKPIEQPPSPQSFAAAQAMRERTAQDEFLVKSKQAGMSYKDIRRIGNFAEAESTLRGRFRTLTKHKTQRVRKPEWEDNDIRLLKKAVAKFTQNSNKSHAKIPWKKVATYIDSHGGSYHFGYATCRKRWDDLESE
ncbi:hypothetical protein IFR05_001893 [Cadophora sp. M221]|nr:hypothetical protein IFR05_001893 [Cadophora sp. M221]